MERVAILIDGQHLHSATKSLGFSTEFTSLRSALTGDGRLIRAFYFSPVDASEEFTSVRPLLDWLSYNGFTVIDKPYRTFTDDSGATRRKHTDLKVELTLAAMEIAPRVDHMIIVSGDADYAPLVEAVQRQGVVVEVVSTIRTTPVMIADSLRRAADIFTDLDAMRHQIERKPSSKAA